MAANTEILASYHTQLVVDHNQLLLHDCEFDFCEADLDLLYKERAPSLHLGVTPGVLAIFTARWNGPVSLDVVGRNGPQMTISPAGIMSPRQASVFLLAAQCYSLLSLSSLA